MCRRLFRVAVGFPPTALYAPVDVPPWHIRCSPASTGRRRLRTCRRTARRHADAAERDRVKERLAQAFVFAGPRGVGKTTTARILARALNCASRDRPPTRAASCDACMEIAEGRDIDVLEIDAATHTQVENVREVIIAGSGDGASARPLQGVHHRRVASAVEPLVQRPAEVDRGAASHTSSS